MLQVIIHDRKPRNGTYCKESIVKLLGENLQLADENVTLCLALGYQRVQRLPGMLKITSFTINITNDLMYKNRAIALISQQIYC